MTDPRAPLKDGQRVLGLSIRDATFGYEKRAVLTDVQLEVPRGSFVSVTGVSGAGKSTFLRAAAGLLRPMKGSVQRFTRKIAWVPQADSLGTLHPVSALEVAAGASGDNDRAAATLASLDLADELRSRFSSLSGGQRQRVLVARAMVLDTEFIVFDEPTSALDEESSALVRSAAARRMAEGATILYATHQPDEVRELETLRVNVAGGSVSPIELDSVDEFQSGPPVKLT